MQKYDTHVCLVSGQATPNITPVLDPEFRPRRVVLVVSGEMVDKAKAIEEVIRPLGVQAERLMIANAFDVRGIEDTLLTWLTEHDVENLALNVTGGTKPMAIAAQVVFRSFEKPVFYVHPEKDQVLFLYPMGDPYDLSNRIRLSPYLKAHGYKILGRQHPALPSAGRKLTEYLLGLIGTKADLIGQLNIYAHGAETSLKSVVVDKAYLEDDDFKKMVGRLSAEGLLQLVQEQLHFTDESARFFCNGGWLEFHVFGVVNDLRAKLHIQDAAMSMEVVSSRKSKNEIDVAFLANNRLHLIECKTKKFSKQASQQGAAETLYKIDSLTALGGLQTKGMLISYQPLKDWDKQRATDLRIETVVGTDILRLPEFITNWVNKGNPA